MKKPRIRFVLPEKLSPLNAGVPIKKTKIQIEFEPYTEPPETPPKVCPCCEQGRPAWHFPDYGSPKVCLMCADNRSNLDRFGGMEWRDNTVMRQAFGVIKRIEMECKNGR